MCAKFLVEQLRHKSQRPVLVTPDVRKIKTALVISAAARWRDSRFPPKRASIYLLRCRLYKLRGVRGDAYADR
jgi:hypothetical protein